MKQINKNLVVLTVFLVITHSSVFAQSENTGWYAGASFGKSTLKPAVDWSGTPATFLQKSRDSGYKILVGYQIDPSFAVEAQYQDLGKYTYSDPGIESFKLKNRGFSVAAVGFLRVAKDFSLIGKAGVALHQFKGDYAGHDVIEHESETKTSLLLGFGTEYNLTPSLALRIEYEYLGKPKIQDTKIKSDLLSVGLRYRF